MSRLFEKALKQKIDEFDERPSFRSKEKLFAALNTHQKFQQREGKLSLLIAVLLVQFFLVPSNWLQDLRSRSSDSQWERKKTPDAYFFQELELHVVEKQQPTVEHIQSDDQMPPIFFEAADRMNTPYLEKRKSLFELPSAIELASPHCHMPEIATKQYHGGFKDGQFLSFGITFLYNNLKPNFSDDLIIENLRGPGRISTNRLGFITRYGRKYDLSEKVTLFGFASANYYQVNYGFDARKSQPEEVRVIQGESIVIQPEFVSETIEIDDFQLALGLGVGSDLYIFPSRNSLLSLAIEYNFNLKDNYSFKVEEKTHRVNYPNRLLLNVGYTKSFKNAFGQFQLGPALRYSLSRKDAGEALSAEPFSAGINFSYVF